MTHDDEPQTIRELGLHVDMTDVDRLREWARLIEAHGSHIGHWASVPFVVSTLRDIAARLAEEIKDVGTLRSQVGGASVSSERQEPQEVRVGGCLPNTPNKAEPRSGAVAKASHHPDPTAPSHQSANLLRALNAIHLECLDEGHTDTGVMGDYCRRRGQVIRCGICVALSDVKAVLESADPLRPVSGGIERGEEKDACAALGSDAQVPATTESHPTDEICICAAIQLPDGRVFNGHRHDACLEYAGRMVFGGHTVALNGVAGKRVPCPA